MNKAVIGWIFAVLVLLGCLAVIGVAAFVGYGLNNDLTKTKADLATANDTITQTSADLDKAKTDITKLNTDLTDAQDQAAQLQTSLDDMTSLKTAAETKFNKTICSTTKELSYVSYDSLQSGLALFAKTVSDFGSVQKNMLYWGYTGPTELWVIDITYNPSSGAKTNDLMFFAFPTLKATFFGNESCWVQAPA